jgi:DsbC/DsbD-like thiol-disulfide interchange protein
MSRLQDTLFAGLAACVLGLTFVGPGQAADAADASQWADSKEAAARLIAGTSRREGHLRAGVEIKLAPGWHTYWRYPGDSGIPPRFDFSGSTNLASAEVLFPAPRLLTDETGNSLGYTEQVIFPVRVTPREPDKPVGLHVSLDYAICEKLCVPAEADLGLTLTGDRSVNDVVLATAEARVPKPVPAAEIGLSARRMDNAPKPRVAVDVAASADERVQIFVEGPTAAWALPVPKPARNAPAGGRRFTFPLDGLPAGADPSKPIELTFTVLKGQRAYQVRTRLD